MENLIENKSKKNNTDDEDGEGKKKRPVIKSATDLQRLKLEKLMKNPEKPIIIPEPPKEKDYMQTVPSFVRNVMGSSAGAGSGEFHVYRHLRRKEYARQKCIQAKSMREQLDDQYQEKLEKNRLESEAKTAKKRAKRLKKKQRAKKPKTKQNEVKEEEQQESDSDEEDDDENSTQREDIDVDDKVEEGVSTVEVVEREVKDDVEEVGKSVTSGDERKFESNGSEDTTETKQTIQNQGEGKEKDADEGIATASDLKVDSNDSKGTTEVQETVQNRDGSNENDVVGTKRCNSEANDNNEGEVETSRINEDIKLELDTIKEGKSAIKESPSAEHRETQKLEELPI